MKIRVATTKTKDIGAPDTSMRWSMDIRKKHNLKTKCSRCGKQITDDYFIGAFKKGYRNMMFHEKCFEEEK